MSTKAQKLIPQDLFPPPQPVWSYGSKVVCISNTDKFTLLPQEHLDALNLRICSICSEANGGFSVEFVKDVEAVGNGILHVRPSVTNARHPRSSSV